MNGQTKASTAGAAPATFAAVTTRTSDSRTDLADILVLLGNLARVEVDPVEHLPRFRPLVLARCPRTTWKDESREVRLHERIVLERLEDVRLDADVARDEDSFGLPRDDAIDEIPACGRRWVRVRRKTQDETRRTCMNRGSGLRRGQ